MFSKSAISNRTYRLIPTKYPPIQTFDDIASADDLEALMELEGWTNDRLVSHRLHLLPKDQWVYGTANASVIMAAFLHTPVNGLRFNQGSLGAWYASMNIRVGIAEVATHLRRETIMGNLEERFRSYRCYAANLTGNYVDIRDYHETLPQLYTPDNYAVSASFGEEQRAKGEDGIIYKSVRAKDGENVVVYKPRHIAKVTDAGTYDILTPKEGKVIAREVA